MRYSLSVFFIVTIALSTLVEAQSTPRAQVACICGPPQTSYSLTASLSHISAIRDKLTAHLEQDPVNYFRKTPSRPYMSSQGISAGKDWAPACNNFVGSWRGYGKWADVIRDDMTEQKYPNLFSNDVATDMATVCPAFHTMTPPQKEGFWIWMTAATAMAESTCNEKSSAMATQGRAAGLFQLPPGKEASYPIGAPANQRCHTGDAATAAGSIRCFLKMQNYYLGARHHVLSQNKTEPHYWQVHYATGGGGQAEVFQRLIKSYAQCKL